jgi:phosphotransferase system  glucose/maltose/N-acetylglucosamine-specific IIC component
MSTDKKRELLGLLIVIGLLMVVLAAGLPGLQMKLGMNLYAQQDAEEVEDFSTSQELDVTNFEAFMRVFSAIVNILLAIYIVISLFSKAGRKRLLGTLGVFVLLILLMIFFSNTFTPYELTEEPPPAPADEGEPLEIEEETRTPVEFEPNPRPWLLTIVIIAGAILLAGIVFFSLSRFSRQKTPDAAQFEEIAEKAQSALEEIEAAKFSFEDIIIRCYADMSLALQAERGIQRGAEMTTFEFEQELIKDGFPARPVQQLTHLFEQVRYGHQDPGEKEKQAAVECLGDIIEFCKESA